MRKFLLILIGLLLPAIVSAQTILPGSRGGTGYATTTAGNIGNCLDVTANNPITFSFTGCAGGSGSTFPFTPTSYGNSTSTTIGFLQNLFTTGSTTIGILHLPLANGELAINGTTAYTTATTTFSGGAVYNNGNVTVGGLTTGNFSSPNISQWTNDAGYVTSSFSTTSANFWSSLGLGFSTTSTNYWLTQQVIPSFSTTSANYWSSLGLGFSTTSASNFAALGLAFSTTSSNYWGSQQGYAKFGYLFPLTSTNFGATANATSSIVSFNAGLFASSTSYFANATTTLATFGTAWIPSLGTPAGTFLAADATGKIIATTTPSGSNSAFSPAANYATTGTLPAYTYTLGVITAVANGALSIDGANPSVGQRVLVKNESGACTSSAGGCNNGLYDVTAAGSGIAAFVLTRDAAYNSSSNVIPGIITYVISGATNDDDFWAMTSAAPITIGTTALTYVEVSGGGASVLSVTGTFPILSSGGTTPLITFGGLTTSTAAVLGNIPYFSGVNTFANVATSSIGAGTGLSFSGTAGAQVGGTGGTYSVNTTQNISTLSNLGSGFVGTNSGVLYNFASSTVFGTLGAPGTVPMSSNGAIVWFATSTSGGSSFAYPFFPSTDGGVNTSATTTALEGAANGLALDVSQFGWYGQGGQVLGYASTTNSTTIFGLSAGGSTATTSSVVTNNSFFGFLAGASINNTNASSISAFGARALSKLTSNTGDTAFGTNAGANTTASENTFMGDNAGLDVTSGLGNIAIGFDSMDLNNASQRVTGSDNLTIGNNTAILATTSSNQMNIAGVLFGQNISNHNVNPVTGQPVPNGTIGISSTTPFGELTVSALSGSSYPGNNLFDIASSTATATTTLFDILNTGFTGIGSTSPQSMLSIGTGANGNAGSITVAESKYGAAGNAATTTSQNIDCNLSTQLAEPIGTSATTLTLINLIPGKKCIVVVQNPNAVAGAITWAVSAGHILMWATTGTGLTVAAPTQVTLANEIGVWSFLTTMGSSTEEVIGAATQ